VRNVKIISANQPRIAIARDKNLETNFEFPFMDDELIFLPAHKLAEKIRDRTQGERKYRNLSFLKNAWRNLLNPSLGKYFEALTERDRLTAQLEQAMEPWDVWLCPVAATTAFTHRLPGMAIEVDEAKLPYLMANGAYTTLFNLTGNPVVVIPIARSQDNLPIGIQLVGKRWQDMALLAIAQKIAEVVTV
jgi:amidase